MDLMSVLHSQLSMFKKKKEKCHAGLKGDANLKEISGNSEKKKKTSFRTAYIY